MSSAHYDTCIQEYTRYADSKTILSAIYELFQRNKEIGKYIGIELKLKNRDGSEIEPDLMALYDNETKGFLFEMKSSLPNTPQHLQSEIEELKKYYQTFTNWNNSTGQVEEQDLVLICHIDDAKKIVNMINILSEKEELSFLTSNHFLVCGWTITPTKDGRREETLRIFRVYGKTTNIKFEELLDEPGGILIPQNILRYVRFKFFFIKQKPPVQYTITILIQHILSSFPEDSGENSCEVDIDTIYNRSEIFFPSWRHYDERTKQLKRQWLSQALNIMVELNIISRSSISGWWKIPKPTYKKRQDIEVALCKDLDEYRKNQRKKGVRKIRRTLAKSKPRKKGPLDKFIRPQSS